MNCEQKVPFVLEDASNGSQEEEEEKKKRTTTKTTPTTEEAPSKTRKKRRLACVFDCSSIKGERQYMEDRWSVIRSKCNRVAVFGVYDGHGGCQVSELLAKMLGDKITGDVDRLKLKPAETITEAFREVDEVAVRENPGNCRRSQVSGKLLGSPGAGSTAIIAVVCSWGKVYFANVGDSKATVVREEGNEEDGEVRENDENALSKNCNNTSTKPSSRRQSLSQSNPSTPRKRQQQKTMIRDNTNSISKIFFETPDQRPAREDERTRIHNIGGKILKSRDGSARVEGILAVTRAFGNAGIKQFVEAVPEIFEFPIEKCGMVVLCTDGVTDVINTENVSSLVAKTIGEDKRVRIERQKQRMSLNNDGIALKNGRNSRLGSPCVNSSLRNERTSSEMLTSVSMKRRSRDNVTAIVFRCSEKVTSFDYLVETTTAAHIHAAIVNHARTVPTSPALSPVKTESSKRDIESEELALNLRESVQAISAANTPSPNKKQKTSSASPNSPLPSSSNKKREAMQVIVTPKIMKSPLGVLKQDRVRSPTLNA